MKDKKMKLGVLLVTILVISFLGAYFYLQSDGESSISAEGRQTFPLVGPAFAQSSTSETAFLEEEAGISLYVNIGQPIDLAVAKTVYRTIEKETADYIVGSIALPGLSENEDVHCFVNKDGWIVTYYLKEEPISKIVGWNLWSGGTLTKNKLQVGLERMTNALGALVIDAKYYHFQYPNANKYMLIIETLVGQGEDSFTITIPLELAVYERSWSHYAQCTASYYVYTSYFKIDGSTINSISGVTSPVTQLGTLTVAQLSPDVEHTVSVSNNCPGTFLYGVCVALAYQEP